MSYSIDFRKKVIEYFKKGNSQRKASKTFGINLSTVTEWNKKYNETGDLGNKILNRKHRKIDPEILKKFIKENSDLYLYEIGEHFNCTGSAIYYALKKLGITHKKR